MKRLFTVAMIAWLSGCASMPPPVDPTPVNYPPLSASEQVWLAEGAQKTPPVISVIRQPSAVKRQWTSDQLLWLNGPNGKYARMMITSPGASAITVGICIRETEAPVTLTVDEVPVHVFEGVSIVDVYNTCEQGRVYWLPIVNGSTATLRFTAAPTQEDIPDFWFELKDLRHRR